MPALEELYGSDGKEQGQKTVTVRLSDETAALIERKLNQWSLKSRSEVVEQVLGWYVQLSDTKLASRRITELL